MLALVMPVYGRVELTAIVMEQRARLLCQLADLGVEAAMVVVGDDADLDTAEHYGFHVVECPNPLGLRINQGFRFAFEGLEADRVLFNGSDSWLLPEPLAEGHVPYQVRASSRLALANGRWLVQVDGKNRWGRAPWPIGRELMEPYDFAPVADNRPRGIDGALVDAILHAGGHFRVVTTDDPLRVVDFRDGPWSEQLTPWGALVKSERRRDRLNPWDELPRCYPADLVGRMRDYYESGGRA